MRTSLRGRIAVVLLVAAAAAAVAVPPAPAGRGDPEDHVRRRIAAMVAAQSALDILGDMSAGRRPFDRRVARAARRDLSARIRSFVPLFRRARLTPRSRARAEIWREWDGFAELAKRNRRAAAALETGRPDRMRRSLTAVVQTCLACHALYRKPP